MKLGEEGKSFKFKQVWETACSLTLLEKHNVQGCNGPENPAVIKFSYNYNYQTYLSMELSVFPKKKGALTSCDTNNL